MNIDVKKVKISVNVPNENVKEIRDAICNEGAGIIGNYTYCTTSIKCIGTFLPSENANPYIGQKKNLNILEEERLEIICNIDIVKNVLKKIREVHPYEEPEINIIPLISEEDL